MQSTNISIQTKQTMKHRQITVLIDAWKHWLSEWVNVKRSHRSSRPAEIDVWSHVWVIAGPIASHDCPHILQWPHTQTLWMTIAEIQLQFLATRTNTLWLAGAVPRTCDTSCQQYAMLVDLHGHSGMRCAASALPPVDHRPWTYTSMSHTQAILQGMPALPPVDNPSRLCTCRYTRVSLLTTYRRCPLSRTIPGRTAEQACAALTGVASRQKAALDKFLHTSSDELEQRLPGLHPLHNRPHLHWESWLSAYGWHNTYWGCLLWTTCPGCLTARLLREACSPPTDIVFCWQPALDKYLHEYNMWDGAALPGVASGPQADLDVYLQINMRGQAGAGIACDVQLDFECPWKINLFTAMGHFHKQPPRWQTILAMLFQILKERLGLSLSEKLEVQYHMIKNMASNFRNLAGCEDGTGTFCC